MANRKRRSIQQIMEEKSLEILRRNIPEEWVIHDYRPDYGIDLVIEIFEYIDSKRKVAETLGEQIFVQVKAVEKAKLTKFKVFSRKNVEKYPLNLRKSFREIDVVKFTIDTSLLLTIQSMGSAIPVILFVVDLETEEIYYLCLSDYIDKFLYHEDPKYYEKEKKVIYIPVKNKFSNIKNLLEPLKFYSKRTKFYSAFMKFNYQYEEIQYESSLEMIKHFIRLIKGLDIWRFSNFQIFKEYYDKIIILEQILYENDLIKKIELIKKTTKINEEEYYSNKREVEEIIINFIVKPLWRNLNNLSNMHEECWRELFLPTHLYSDEDIN